MQSKFYCAQTLNWLGQVSSGRLRPKCANKCRLNQTFRANVANHCPIASKTFEDANATIKWLLSVILSRCANCWRSTRNGAATVLAGEYRPIT
jgi:hypothetical protein